MHCNLRPPETLQSLVRFNYDAMPCLTSLNLSISVLQLFCCWYITLRCDDVIWTFDHWPWTFAMYRLWCVKLCAKFECHRAIHGRVTAILIFDLMTLNMCYMLRSALGYFSSSLTFETYPCLNYSAFYADTFCYYLAASPYWSLKFLLLRPL